MEPVLVLVLLPVAVGEAFDMSTLLPGPHQAELAQRLERVFAGRTRSEWEAFSREHEVCLEPVLAPEEVPADPHAAARGLFFDLASPFGPLRQMRTPITPRGDAHRPPPRQGEHTREILREAGFADDAIDALVKTGAARVA